MISTTAMVLKKKLTREVLRLMVFCISILSSSLYAQKGTLGKYTVLPPEKISINGTHVDSSIGFLSDSLKACPSPSIICDSLMETRREGIDGQCFEYREDKDILLFDESGVLISFILKTPTFAACIGSTEFRVGDPIYTLEQVTKRSFDVRGKVRNDSTYGTIKIGISDYDAMKRGQTWALWLLIEYDLVTNNITEILTWEML